MHKINIILAGHKTAGKITAADFVGAFWGFLGGTLWGPVGMAVGTAVGAGSASSLGAISEM